MKTITIAGEKFEVTSPYTAGMPLDEAMARTLNQTRSENIGNNFRKQVEKAAQEGKLDDVRRAIAEYDAQYTFAVPGSGTRVVRDPVEREARAIARTAIVAHLAKSGRKIKDVDEEKFEAELEKYAQRDDVLKMAKKRVQEKARIADSIMSEIGDLGTAESEPQVQTQPE